MTQNEKKSICIILGSAHGADVAGKQSPDASLREYQWSREMCTKIQKKLQDDGYRCIVDSLDANEIGLPNRVQIVNNYCGYFGSSKCIYVSIHNNAAPPVDGQWHKAQGWEAHVAKKASENSKKLSSLLYKEAEKEGLKLRRPLKTQDYWASNYYVLKNTKCPAVLTENMFQDNKEDVKYLLSKDGKDALARVHVNAIEKYVNEMIVK